MYVRYVRIFSSTLCDNIKVRSFNSDFVIHEERIFDFPSFEIRQSELRVGSD